MSSTIKTPGHVRALLLATLPRKDATLVLNHLSHGSTAALTADLTAQVQGELAKRAREAIAVPAELLPGGDADGWTSAAYDAAEHLRATGEAPPFHDWMRATGAAAQARAAAAQAEAEDLGDSLSSVQAQLDELDERWELFLSHYGDIEATTRDVRWYQAGEVALWLAEAGLSCGTAAVLLGVTGQHWSLVDPATCATVAATSVVLTLGLVGSGFLAGTLVAERDAAVDEADAAPPSWLPVWATVGLGVCVVGAATAMRWAASTPAGSLTVTSVLAGQAGLAVALSAGGLVAMALAAGARRSICNKQRLVRLFARERRAYLERRKRFVARRDELLAKLAETGKRMEAPELLPALWEQAVRSCASDLNRHDKEVAERVTRAVAVLEEAQGKGLSRVDQDDAVEQLLSFVPRGKKSDDDDGSGGAAPAGGSTGGPLARVLRGVSKAVVLLALLPALQGCGELAVPRHLVLVCDGTGVRPEEVCTPDFLEAEARRWAATAVGVPGSTLTVTTTAGAFSETRTVLRVEVPARFSGDPRLGREQWTGELVEAARTVPVPVDTPEDRRVNKSALLAAVAVAAGEQCMHDAPGQVELVVASDGRFVSSDLKLNAEAAVPTAEQVVRSMGERSWWDLSCVQAVRFCGLHNAGTTPAQLQALQETLAGLVTASGGPAPTFSASCQGRNALAVTFAREEG